MKRANHTRGQPHISGDLLLDNVGKENFLACVPEILLQHMHSPFPKRDLRAWAADMPSDHNMVVGARESFCATTSGIRPSHERCHAHGVRPVSSGKTHYEHACCCIILLGSEREASTQWGKEHGRPAAKGTCVLCVQALRCVVINEIQWDIWHCKVKHSTFSW